METEKKTLKASDIFTLVVFFSMVTGMLYFVGWAIWDSHDRKIPHHQARECLRYEYQVGNEFEPKVYAYYVVRAVGAENYKLQQIYPSGVKDVGWSTYETIRSFVSLDRYTDGVVQVDCKEEVVPILNGIIKRMEEKGY